MIPTQKWANIQPKCTVHIDFAKKEYSVHLTNSPEAELQLLGLTPDQRNPLIIRHLQTAPHVQKGRAFGYYAKDIPYAYTYRMRQYHRNTYIRAGVYEMSWRVREGCVHGNGQIWAMFGGSATIQRLINMMEMGFGITFIRIDGFRYSSQLTEWQISSEYYKTKYELQEAGGYTMDAAITVMHLTDTSDAIPDDEEHIDRD